MTTVGYAHLQTQLEHPTLPLVHPANLRPVSRMLDTPDELQIPRAVAPKSDDAIDHLLFALRYEGIELPILAEAMRTISAADLIDRLRKSPSSIFVRKACYLWEWLSGNELTDLPAVAGPYGNLFDPDKYVTGAKRRCAKWRIDFNGLGSARYCPTVRLTPAIRAGLNGDVLGKTHAFLASLGASNADRALSWAYLSETDSTFAIEREAPSANETEAFILLLQQAHEKIELTEDYLADLQSATITNPFDRAVSFRHEQNWLRRGALRGSSSVTYVPPPPALLADLMPAFMDMTNALARQIDPIIAASVAAFGFVFLHPFMDGNGRLSRFLFHHALCRSGKLEKGLLLPVSVAMKRHEAQYLEALQSFSKPARKLWDVSWTGDDDFTFQFTGSDTVYRFWDATPCVEFGFQMAEQALDVDLRQETEFLARFDRISKALNDEYDVRGNDQHLLIVSALQNGGRVSNNRRRQLAERVPAEVFDFVERIVQDELSGTV
ncbi:MAG: Fic family protein [Janthinobacterium lividum]